MRSCHVNDHKARCPEQGVGLIHVCPALRVPNRHTNQVTVNHRW